MINIEWTMSESGCCAEYYAYRITITKVNPVEQNAYRSVRWIIAVTVGGNEFTIASGFAPDVYCAQNITAAIVGVNA